MSGKQFGGHSRAVAGCIVTFELPDGSTRVEHFNQLVRTTDKRTWKRTQIREGAASIVQAAERADALGAKIMSVSTPQTILTDLQGTRAPLEAKRPRDGTMPTPSSEVHWPEALMLGAIERLDLFKRPSSGLQPKQNIRQVRQLRPSHSGPRDS